MNFRSIKDLYQDVWSNLHRLPHDIELVVGIPRSGMLVATMIALARNLPLADLEGYLAGRVLASGNTRRERDGATPLGKFRHVLVVDDSCRTGQSLRAARASLAAAACDTKLTFCVAYGTGRDPADVDIVFRAVPEPRVFEWNVLHHPIIERSCLDIDGVLCLDPTDRQNDDGAAYLDFLATALPLHRPRREIAVLVTARLEKYREQTEAWLRRQGIRYRSLRMLDLPDASLRGYGTHARFKAQVYRETDCALFIESSLTQARDIARYSGKPVLSLKGPEMVRPGALNPAALRDQLRPNKLTNRVRRRIQRLVGVNI